MSKIVPRTFRGTRDFLPTELLGRRKILKVIEEAYRRYGFQPLETPAIEYLEILTGKSEENDKLIYEIRRARGAESDSAETAIALRYDLTVPLARVVAQHPELPRPFKRYQIQPVWRADRPQPRQGRFREFVQCDADILGTDSLLADAEIIALTYEVLRDLGFENFKIRLSSRKFLMGVARSVTTDSSQIPTFMRILDKLDKIDWDGVESEWKSAGIDYRLARGKLEKARAARGYTTDEPQFKHLRDSFPESTDVRAGIEEVESVYDSALSLGVQPSHLFFDPILARGLDYYTGPIFETILPELPHLGSLSGGGRYDGLVETFSKQRVPATGTTLGLDRIQSALTQLEKFQSAASETQALIARFDSEGIPENLRIAAMLRKKNIRVEIWYDDDRMKKQFSYADKQQIPLVIIAGPDERANGQVSLKNLRTGKQKAVSIDGIVEAVHAELHELSAGVGE